MVFRSVLLAAAARAAAEESAGATPRRRLQPPFVQFPPFAGIIGGLVGSGGGQAPTQGSEPAQGAQPAPREAAPGSEPALREPAASSAWAKRGDPSKDCTWVAGRGPSKCNVIGADGRPAYEACPSCGGTAFPTPRPTPAEQSFANKATQTPTHKPSTPRPSSRPTPRPTQTPTPRPSLPPSPRPTPQPSPGPTPRPSLAAVRQAAEPSPEPSTQPTPRPSTPGPSPRPTQKPTPRPSERPTPKPSPLPSPRPTLAPTVTFVPTKNETATDDDDDACDLNDYFHKRSCWLDPSSKPHMTVGVAFLLVALILAVLCSGYILFAIGRNCYGFCFGRNQRAVTLGTRRWSSEEDDAELEPLVAPSSGSYGSTAGAQRTWGRAGAEF